MNPLHSFEPAAGDLPLVLILGSMPGVESLRQQQYYAFPRNTFWRIMGEYFHFCAEEPYPDRLRSLNAHQIALWDVLSRCERKGSLDSAIGKEIPNDIPGFLRKNPSIRLILCNGSAACSFLKKYYPQLFEQYPVLRMPSTSPAAAMFSFEQKQTLWTKALDSIFRYCGN